jgi:hypothetical protein
MRHIHVWPCVQALDVFAHQTPLHDLSKELPTSTSVHIGRSLFVFVCGALVMHYNVSFALRKDTVGGRAEPAIS